MAKNCTCSLLLETIDKIFIDDSCCCQNTVVTPTGTGNSCSCEPVIDLIDTDRFACPSFDHNRNLKYLMIRESWLVHGTDSKTVYDAIIESLASEIMLLLKVVGGGVNENSRNYVISPIEVSQDVESELYIVKYFKFIEGKLSICTYTIHKTNDNEYETNWEYDEMDDFDASQYYNKSEIDSKNYATVQYLTNYYYTNEEIDHNFYTRNLTYNKNEIDNFFNTKVLWEKGLGQSSTQRKNASCYALGNYSFAAGTNNTSNGEGTATLGVENTADGKYSFVAGYRNNINGDSNIVAGNNNTVTSNNNITAGSNNTLNDASYSGAIGYGNNVSGNFNFAGGQSNTIKDTSNNSFSFGNKNEITGDQSASFGTFNTITGNNSLVAGSDNKITGTSSSTVGRGNIINGSSAAALGITNTITNNNCFALGCNNYAKSHYSVALNEANRTAGIASVAAGRRSYTEKTSSFAMGSPVGIKYFAKLAAPNANIGDTYYGYLVLTDEAGNPVNIIRNSILDKRFTFAIAEGKYWGELTIPLTNEELEDSTFTNKFPLGATWPSIKDIIIVESSTTRYIYFLPAENEQDNIIWLFNHTDNGIRNISYASGYDGCKATDIGAHAEGYGAIATGIGSHSEGVNTFALNTAEHACGKYNYSGNNTIFSIGIGNEEYVNSEDGSNVVITRKNALEVTDNGKIYLRINENNTENVYDLGKLLTALINTTSLDLSGIVLDSNHLRLITNSNLDQLTASTKEL